MVRDVYEFVFIHSYKWSVKVNGADYYHVLTACMAIAFVIVINAMTIAGVLGQFIEIPILESESLRYYLIGSALVITAISFIYFSMGDRVARILEVYESRWSPEGWNGKTFIWMIGGSVFAQVASWYLISALSLASSAATPA